MTEGLDAHVREDGGDAVDGADELGVRGFEFGEGFLQAAEGGVRVVILRGGGDGDGIVWEVAGFEAELGEELLEFGAFFDRKVFGGAEALLDLDDGVLDHGEMIVRGRKFVYVCSVVEHDSEDW